MQRGDVVQIRPETTNKAFAGCFMLVTEVKSWGVQGFIALPTERDRPPARAYYRATFDEVMKIGVANWVPEDLDGC